MKHSPRLDRNNLDHMAQVLKAVAHPLRLRLLELLCQSEHTVNELTVELDVGQALVSQQLKTMRTAGIVVARRDASRRFYGLALPELRRLLDCLVACQGRCRSAAAPGALPAATHVRGATATAKAPTVAMSGAIAPAPSTRNRPTRRGRTSRASSINRRS